MVGCETVFGHAGGQKIGEAVQKCSTHPFSYIETGGSLNAGSSQMQVLASKQWRIGDCENCQKDSGAEMIIRSKE